MTVGERPSVPILLSTDVFEDFYGTGLGLTRASYLATYRNDWSWEYAYALRDQGLRPVIYIASHGPSEHAATNDGIDVRFLGLNRLDAPWKIFPGLKRTPPGRWLHQVANAAALLPALRQAVRDDRAAALMVQEYWTGRWDVLSRSVSPIIGIDQGMPERREIKLLKSRTLGRARAIVVQTRAEGAKVERHGGTAIRIPNGVDTSRFAPPERRPPGHEILILCRLLDVQKRVSDLLRALVELPNYWTLRIVGGGPDQPMLEALAAELGVADRCRFVGFVIDREVVLDALRTAAVFALPSAYEGLPMALLEAMACGCAVVGSSIPAIADVIDDGRTGRTVSVGDVPALASAIVDAGHRRVELGAAARQSVLSTYSREACGAALARLIRGPA
jgi:glycosyltransferase involved in cell wall biosynthesis